jgi:hypothetical protein
VNFHGQRAAPPSEEEIFNAPDDPTTHKFDKGERAAGLVLFPSRLSLFAFFFVFLSLSLSLSPPPPPPPSPMLRVAGNIVCASSLQIPLPSSLSLSLSFIPLYAPPHPLSHQYLLTGWWKNLVGMYYVRTPE